MQHAVWQIGDTSRKDTEERTSYVPKNSRNCGNRSSRSGGRCETLVHQERRVGSQTSSKNNDKTDNTPIKMSWDSFIENDKTERKVSPFGKMNIQVADMSTNTEISLHSLGKEFNFLESLQPTKRSPEYWQNLGSSKTRTVLGWECKSHQSKKYI